MTKRRHTKRWPLYLLHFDRPYHHARHYLGTSPNVEARVTEHLAGIGSPLVRAAISTGVVVTLVRTWDRGGRPLERKLKNQKNGPRYCPICSPSSTSLVEPSKNPQARGSRQRRGIHVPSTVKQASKSITP